MSFSPTKWSMATAMGQKMAATTTFGRKTESRVEARNQTKIWFFIEVPMQQSVLTENPSIKSCGRPCKADEIGA